MTGSDESQVAVGADGRADDRRGRTDPRADRALHRQALAGRRRDLLRQRALPLDRARSRRTGRRSARSSSRARGSGGAAQLPGHLQGPDRDHRRRPLEDVLPLRLRLRGEARRRDVPAHGRADAADPGDDDGDVLDPLPAQAHPRPPRPLQGRAALPPRADRPARRRRPAGSASARTSATGRRARA